MNQLTLRGFDPELEKRLREAEEAAKEAAREMEGVVAGWREEQVGRVLLLLLLF